jgi:hypothetical protein
MHPSLLSNLDLHLQGKYRLGASAERDLHQGLWNGSADSNTAVLVKCSSSDDVQAAVRIAGEAQRPSTFSLDRGAPLASSTSAVLQLKRESHNETSLHDSWFACCHPYTPH